MKFFKDNKVLLLKYLGVVISNILIYIFVNFYCKNISNNFLIMCVLVIVSDLFIFFYKEKVTTKYYLDIIASFIIGFILNFFIKDDVIYSTILFTLFFANNIIFMKNKKETTGFKQMLRYFIVILVTILVMFVNLVMRMYLFK